MATITAAVTIARLARSQSSSFTPTTATRHLRCLTTCAAQEPNFPISIIGDVGHGKTTLISRPFNLSAMATVTSGVTVARLARSQSYSFTPSTACLLPTCGRAAQEPNIPIIMIGDVGHGKTTLTAALSMALGSLEKRYPHYAFMDFPVQSDYAKKMVSGAVAEDMAGAILVVSGVEGLTKEHIITLAKLGGDPKMVVFLNKQDQLHDDDQLHALELEVRRLLSSFEFPGDDIPIVAGSALLALEALKKKKETKIKRGENEWVDKVYKLMDEMDNYIYNPDLPDEEMFKNDRAYLPFLMTIADTGSGGPFPSLRYLFPPGPDEGTIGSSTVTVVGRIERGHACLGDPLELVGLRDTSKRDVIIEGVVTVGVRTDISGPGKRVELLLSGVHKNDVHWGMVLAEPGTIATFHRKFTAIVYVLKEEEGGRWIPILVNERLKFHMSIDEVNWIMDDRYENEEEKATMKRIVEDLDNDIMLVATGKVNSIIDNDNDIVDELEHGEHYKMEVELITPMACVQGMRFAIRDLDGNATGLGVIQALTKEC